MDNIQTSNADALNATTYKCLNCGGAVQYDIVERRFLCSFCKSEYQVAAKGNVEEYNFNDYAKRANSSAQLVGISTVICNSCGGEVFFNSHETARQCPMCGSSNVRSQVAESGIAPEGIVPFRIDIYDAQEKFRVWIKKRWFAPNLLKKSYSEGTLQGVYIPFWTYDAEASAAYHGQGGHTRTRRDSDGKTHTYTQWYPVSGRVSRNFDDVQVCASKSQAGTIVNKVLPYNTISDINPFASEYLSGYLAESYTIDGRDGFETARSIMENQLRSDAMSDIRRRGYDSAQVNSLQAAYSNVTYKSVLLPLYKAQYNYREKMYTYAVNGQTGKVVGKYPKSAVKIAALVAVIIAVLVGLFLLYNNSSNSGGSYENYNVSDVSRYHVETSLETVYTDDGYFLNTDSK